MESGTMRLLLIWKDASSRVALEQQKESAAAVHVSARNPSDSLSLISIHEGKKLQKWNKESLSGSMTRRALVSSAAKMAKMSSFISRLFSRMASAVSRKARRCSSTSSRDPRAGRQRTFNPFSLAFVKILVKRAAKGLPFSCLNTPEGHVPCSFLGTVAPLRRTSYYEPRST